MTSTITGVGVGTTAARPIKPKLPRGAVRLIPNTESATEITATEVMINAGGEKPGADFDIPFLALVRKLYRKSG